MTTTMKNCEQIVEDIQNRPRRGRAPGAKQ
jgi:hypothetical protein